MVRNREINLCIWMASMVLYLWIKGGGAEAELTWAKEVVADTLHDVVASEDCP